jgi:hypothetical protein
VHKLPGEFGSVSRSAINDWHLDLVEILKYAPRDIYKAGISALYYNLLPDKTHVRVGSRARNV